MQMFLAIVKLNKLQVQAYTPNYICLHVSSFILSFA